MQAVRQCPFNLRPVLGVKPLESAIGRGYMTAGFLEMAKRTKETRYGDLAREGLSWLILHKAPDCQEFSWGKDFDYASRGGRFHRFEPITVWTSLIGHVFLDAHELMGDGTYLSVSRSACDWIMALPRNVTNSGICLSYYLSQQEPCTIHNHNMLAAALLARVGKRLGNPGYLRLARQAMEYSCRRQRPDGAWPYGESLNMTWVDGFHTGYDLDALKIYIDSSGDRTFEGHLGKGLIYYMDKFFESDGRPKYYDRRAYPIDIQCAAQGIETLVKLSTIEGGALELARKVAHWTIENLQDRRGFFYYRQYPGIKTKTPMIHWGQSIMYKALALLVPRLAA